MHALQHEFDLVQNFMRRHAHHCVSVAREKARSRGVVRNGFRMLITIHLDDEPRREANEVGDVGTYRHFPPELESAETPVAGVAP